MPQLVNGRQERLWKEVLQAILSQFNLYSMHNLAEPGISLSRLLLLNKICKEKQMTWRAITLYLTHHKTYRNWSLVRKTWKPLETKLRVTGHQNFHMKRIWKKHWHNQEQVHKTFFLKKNHTMSVKFHCAVSQLKWQGGRERYATILGMLFKFNHFNYK